jgi:serine/threonine-protein kinase HipA
MAFNIVFANRDDHSRNFSFLMDENCNWSYSPAYDLTYSGTNSNLNWHQLTIDKKPTTDIRSLGIIKIAKLCGVKEPLEILANMIDVKHAMLREFCTEYGVEQELVEMIFKDTANIDKMFGGK